MPSSNLPDPDRIPDMRLPERENQSTGKPPREGLVPIKLDEAAASNGLSSSISKSRWRAGDRVLAPWEPMFVYAGTIAEIASDQALIDFDDGDSGWVFLDQVRPILLTRGQEVLSRRKMGLIHFPGEIGDVIGEEVEIIFEDGQEEWTTVAALRIPCRESGPGAQPTKIGSHNAFLERLGEGDRVWAIWNNQAFFPGTVTDLRSREAHIRFDDGDRAWVTLEQLMPLEFVVGMFVVSRWKMGSNFYPGTITEVRDGRVHVQYDDGDAEWTKPAALALPLQVPPGVASTGGGFGQRVSVRNWLIGIGLVVAVVMLIMRALR